MSDHIDLDRVFVEFDAKNDRESDSESYALRGLFDSKPWREILKKPCTVILAEAGNGKTSELRHQAKLLRSQGKAAFFCNLVFRH
jgi:hypothetical protein